MRSALRSMALLAGGAVLLATAPSLAEENETPSPTKAAGDVHHHANDSASHDRETIVITGSPLEHDRDELAVPVDRVDREELLQGLGATLGETLSTRPGIATSGFTGGASRPVIRGQDAFRTEVTEDGLVTQDVSRESADHAIPVNPLAVERVEIVRGPATLRYGGGATAGVVNAITNRVPDVLTETRITGELFGGVDSGGERRDAAVNLDGSLGPVGFHVDGLLRRSDEYEIPGAGNRQAGSQVDAFAGSAGASYFFGEAGRLGASFSRFESEYGLPEEDEDAEIDLRANRVSFEGDLFDPLPGVREARLRGVYTDYEHDEKVDGVIGQTFQNDQFDARLELLHDPILGFLGAVGFTGRHRDFEAQGEAFEFLRPSKTASGAFYVFEERELMERLVGEFGFRVEVTNVEGTPCGSTAPPCVEPGSRDNTFVPISGSAGLVFTPAEGVSFGLTGAASQRAPAEVELIARGPHEATGTYEIGDPSLDEETSYTGKVRGAFENERGRIEAAGFVTWYEDYIFGDLQGFTVNEDGDPPGLGDDEFDVLRFQARNARFAGMELFGRLNVYEGFGGTFSLDGQFDYVRAIFTSGGDVPRITPIRWGGGARYACEWVTARVGFLRTEEQTDVGRDGMGNRLTRTGDFTFLNTSLTVSLAPLFPAVPVELSIIGNNLNDAKGRNVLSFNVDEVVLPGRNVRGLVRARF